MPYEIFIAILVASYLLLRQRFLHPPHRARFPPGPKPKLLIGNLYDIPGKRDWEVYDKWAKKYGEIVHYRIAGQSTIVLNSYKVANALLESRSSIYSDRPHLVMLRDLMGERGTALAPYGETWKKQRKLYNQRMNRRSVKQYQSIQTTCVNRLLKELLESPESYATYIRHMAGSVVVQISYGVEIPWNKFEQYVALSDRNSEAVIQAMRPGEYLVDTFPILKYMPSWIPGAQFKVIAKQTRQDLQQALDGPFREIKNNFLKGSRSPSIVSDELSRLGSTNEDEEEVDVVKVVAASIAEAGTGTTTFTTLWFILAMVLYPEVQKNAQKELDTVIGSDRLPTFEDYQSLPYIEAILKEAHRWYPVAVTGVPHFTTVEDVYEGYSIPANSVVITNNWKILRDESIYSDPWTFKPERFLPDDPKDMPPDPRLIGVFGWGRRICPGRHLADGTVWLAIVSVLALFNISKARDKNGNEIDVEYAKELSDSTFLSCPKEFPCALKPRSKDAELLIKQLDPN
ncbi:hypothetical protein M422DRAFT_26040 [Sphaerobolus stellatus SS14]|nr:hypothetical protein M422DRAFT_26040 [Sphaerobolus stellatus SS14]